MTDLTQMGSKTGFWELLNQIHSEHGLIVLLLMAFLGFVCFLFWKLIWNVWSAAQRAKDEEIARLAKERDKYQALFFERLRTSELAMAKARKVATAQRERGDLN
jgi:hypothetical protein